MTQPDRIAKGMYWDRAWSLVSGCSYVSEGCRNCWSAAETHMRACQKNEKIRSRYAGLTTPEGRWNGQIRLLEQNLWLPARVKKPTSWAIWNDLLHPDVPDDFIRKVLHCIWYSSHHTFLLLTKRPERIEGKGQCSNCGYLAPVDDDAICPNCGVTEKHMREQGFGNRVRGLHKNLWLGATCEDQEQFDKRWPYLRDTPAAIVYISYEPALGPLVLPSDFLQRGKQAWVVCGCESGPNRRAAKIEWIRDLRDQCVAAGVDFFLKQMEIDGKIVKMPELDGKIWDEIPHV